MTENNYSKAAKDRWAKMDPAKRSEIARKRAHQRWDNLTPSGRRLQALKSAETRSINK